MGWQSEHFMNCICGGCTTEHIVLGFLCDLMEREGQDVRCLICEKIPRSNRIRSLMESVFLISAIWRAFSVTVQKYWWMGHSLSNPVSIYIFWGRLADNLEQLRTGSQWESSPEPWHCKYYWFTLSTDFCSCLWLKRRLSKCSQLCSKGRKNLIGLGKNKSDWFLKGQWVEFNRCTTWNN